MGRQGVLHFSLFADTGNDVNPPASDLSGSLARRLQRSWGSQPTVQVQAFSGIMFQAPEDDLAQLLRLHLETRRELRAALLRTAPEGGA